MTAVTGDVWNGETSGDDTDGSWRRTGNNVCCDPKCIAEWYIDRQVAKAWSNALCIWETEIWVDP